MVKKKLMDEISISELQHMREEGMSNQEIADVLGVTYATVFRYLGRQPKGLRKKPTPSATPELQKAMPVYACSNPNQELQKEEEEDILLLSDEKITVLGGTVGYYTISDKRKSVRISIGKDENEIEVPFEKFPDFIQELMRILKNSHRFIGREGY